MTRFRTVYIFQCSHFNSILKKEVLNDLKNHQCESFLFLSLSYFIFRCSTPSGFIHDETSYKIRRRWRNYFEYAFARNLSVEIETKTTFAFDSDSDDVRSNSTYSQIDGVSVVSKSVKKAQKFYEKFI